MDSYFAPVDSPVRFFGLGEPFRKHLRERIGIERSDAEEFACTMEHSIPDHILTRLVKFADYTEKCPSFSASWRESAEGYFCRAQGCDALRCDTCRLPES